MLYVALIISRNLEKHTQEPRVTNNMVITRGKDEESQKRVKSEGKW